MRERAAPLAALALALCALAAPASATPTVVDSKFELYVSDLPASVAFYGSLGFTVVLEEADGYTALRSGPAVVALKPVPGWLPLDWLGFLRRPPVGSEVVLYTDRLESLREALLAAGHAPGPIVLQPWGQRDFEVTDPAGYFVRVSEGRPAPAH